jgi:hypothetical protein
VSQPETIVLNIGGNAKAEATAIEAAPKTNMTFMSDRMTSHAADAPDSQ